ncbi:IS701 family transposase [Streptacidiphilus sp. EB129]|uniref:IS701 family transposase n=1 Tax=Streptacidiphilus sp. EB129 TaxID=3156262 RepID=UPI003515CCEF
MSTISYLHEPRPEERPDGISAYCQDLFALLPRSDQRHWGEVYLRGLLQAPGRKTPTRISEEVLGRKAVQPLQQFVNQSPWDHNELRRHMAARMRTAAPPRAWAFDEVVFPKNGVHSVGVARQFVASQGRVVNCQLALATSLVHADGGVPVNWQLLLPRHWDGDQELRDKARIPAQERHRPRWRYVLESVDELLERWDMPPAPVLADWRHDPEVEPLLRGLEARGLGYLIEVAPTTRLHQQLTRHESTGHAAQAAQLVHRFCNDGQRTAVAWRPHPDAGPRHTQFVAVELPAGPARGQVGPPQRTRPAVPPRVRPTRAEQPRRRPGARHLVAEWPFGRSQPRAYWVTNLSPHRLTELVALAELRHHSHHGCARLQQDFGLGDFEGRSFRGWHHHVTLASAALAFHALRNCEAAPDGAETEPGGSRWTTGRSASASSSARAARVVSVPGG